VTGQNGCEQNGIRDKMVWDKMIWTKWYGQNGSNFLIDYNSSEFNSYLVTKSPK